MQGLIIIIMGTLMINGSLKSGNYNTMEAFLQKEVEQGKTPSVQYIMFDRDRIIHQYRAGFADIKNKRPADAHTTYNAYSITKTFTALAVMQLAEQQLIDIDNPVASYLPDFPYPSEITVRHLLTHSSGIPNPIPLSWIHLIDEHNSFSQESFFEQIISAHDKVKFQPNEKFAYSNLGYIILGQLIEKVKGGTYEDYIEENIIDKMGLSAHELGFAMAGKRDHATGYHPKLSVTNLVLGLFMNKSKFMDEAEGQWKPFHHFYVNGSAYGGLIGSTAALARYGQELINPDSKWISQRVKQQLFTENETNKGKLTGMCMSWFKGQLDGHPYFAHAGGGGGYYLEIRVYPGLGIGSVIACNRTGMSDERFLDKVDHLLIDANDNAGQAL